MIGTALPLLAQDKQAPTDPPKLSDALDDELKKSLGEGEDIGPPQDPLIKIGEEMRTSQQRIGDGQTDMQTQDLQRQIVADLDRLMRDLKRQQSQQSKAGGGGRGGRGQVQPQRQSAKSSAGSQDRPARDSSDKLREEQARKAQLADVKKSLHNLWGDLPERDRDQALQSLGDNFLPKYDTQIRKFFERLGEEGGRE